MAEAYSATCTHDCYMLRIEALYVHMLVLMHEMPHDVFVCHLSFIYEMLYSIILKIVIFSPMESLELLKYQYSCHDWSFDARFKGVHLDQRLCFHDISLWRLLLLLCDWWHSFIIPMSKWCIPIVFHDTHMHSSLSFHSLSIHIYSVPLFYNGDRW